MIIHIKNSQLVLTTRNDHLTSVLAPSKSAGVRAGLSATANTRDSCTRVLPAGCFRALPRGEILPLLRQLASGEAESQFLNCATRQLQLRFIHVMKINLHLRQLVPPRGEKVALLHPACQQECST